MAQENVCAKNLQIHNCQCGNVVNMYVSHNPTVFHKYLHKSVHLQYMASCNLISNKNHSQNRPYLMTLVLV